VPDDALQLHEETDDGSGTTRFRVLRGDLPVAVLNTTPRDPSSLRVWAALDPLAFTAGDAEQLFTHIVDVARSGSFEHLELGTPDPLLRDTAARAGMTGPLRGLLARSVADLDPQGPRTEPLDADELAAAVGRLVPDAAVVGRAVRNPLRAGIRRALFGLPAMVDLLVDPRDGGERIRVVVPQRPDVVVENVARCIDTLVGVRRRFGANAPPSLTLSFDYSDMGLRTGVISGSAATQVGVIHMNADHCLVEGIEMARRRAAEHGHGVSARMAPPFSAVDATTAHEMWHQIEGNFEAARYRESIEFRRGIGECLGVETLEQAILGANRNASPSWRAAHRRLVEEVSAYAATSPREATAEMFKLWWCSNGEVTPVVARFGALVDGLFPASA
jgi:hypothetical protein